MSPEQASSSNDQIGPASDVYSLGAILYELLTGEPPFKDESPLATLLLVVNQDVIPPSQLNPDCDRDLEAICLTCLNKDPQARYSTCEQLAADFGRYLAGEPVRAQRLTGPKKLWYWLREMPLVAYCTRRKQNSAHRAQHLTQWAAILTLLVGFSAYIAMPSIIERAYLQQVEIGVGNMNGAYHLLADQITPQAQPIFSKGSEECLAKLLNYEVDLGILQANTKSKQQSAGLDPVAIVAPLYQEAILVICRKTAKIASARELAGKAIALGEPGSGVRVTSDEILDKLGIQTQPQFQDSAWAALTENNSLDGAIVTASLKDSRLAKLLGTGQFRVVPLQQHELPSNVRPHRFQLDEWPPGAEHLGVVDSGTVDAVLVTRRTAPAWFVKRTLTTMYGKRNTSLSTAGKVRIADQLDQSQLIMSPKDAAGWSIGRSLHPAAREFFAPTNLGDAPHETQ